MRTAQREDHENCLLSVSRMCLGRGFAGEYQAALAIEKVEADLSLHRIDDNKAMALGVSGSPSVFINGKELQPQGLVGFS